MKLTDKVQLIFKNPEGKKATLTITVSQLLEYNSDRFYDLLDEQHSCTSASCNNEYQNFCDCQSDYDDYEIVEVLTK